MFRMLNAGFPASEGMVHRYIIKSYPRRHGARSCIATAGCASFLASCLYKSKYSSVCEGKLLSAAQSADVSHVVQERFNLPLVPQSIQFVLVQRMVDFLASEIEKRTDVEDYRLTKVIQEALDDGVTEERVVRICNELEPALASQSMPLLTPPQQRDLLETVVRAILAPESRPMGIIAVREVSHGIDALLEPQRRALLVKDINSKVDIPFLDEAQEAVAIGAMLDAVSSALTRLVPREYLDLLRGSTSIEVADFKGLVTGRIVEVMPAVPGISSEKGASAVASVVDVLFDALLAGSIADEAAASLSDKGRLKFLLQRKTNLTAELDLANRGYRRRKATLDRQLAVTTKEVDELDSSNLALKIPALLVVAAGGIAGAFMIFTKR